jgi:hypothetical protein
MQLDGNLSWFIALCFGAFMVGTYSWSRFDEHSYDSETGYFARYKPRFSTSYGRYVRAKLGYVCAILVIYLVFALVPELFGVFAGVGADEAKAKAIAGSVPLAVVIGLITLQNAPGLKDLERKIRGFLHAFARIPECVRRTAAQMRSSPFKFKPHSLEVQTRRLGPQIGTMVQPETLNRLIFEDETLHAWYSIGSVLCSLSENKRETSGIDLLFFDHYKDELDAINAKYVALAELVRDRVAECVRAGSPAGLAADTNESAAFREIRDLRDRLYTFVACGVHSSRKSDAESLEIVRRLGFAIGPTDPGKKSILGALAGLALIALLMLSIFTGYSGQLFHDQVLHPLPRAWDGVFPVPKETLSLYAWSWSTALFYFMAILGALALRNSRVVRRQWFDLDNLDRERPILRYITPTLAGTALGCATLVIIAIMDGPAFNATSYPELRQALFHAFRQTLPWFPLATVMAFLAVMLSDSQLGDDGFWRNALRRSLYCASAMAVVGFLTSHLNVTNGISTFADDHGLEPMQVVSATGKYVSLFIALQIGLFVAMLGVVVQVAERYTDRARSFAGKHIQAVTRQGPMFCVYFGPDGKATLFDRCEDNSGAPPILCRGEWQQFPEGTVVKWDTEADGGRCKAGDFGLISSYGDSLIYEGYKDQLGGTADFVAQVQPRSKPAKPVPTILRSVTNPALTA